MLALELHRSIRGTDPDTSSQDYKTWCLLVHRVRQRQHEKIRLEIEAGKYNATEARELWKRLSGRS